jgi:hypothetical protein
VVLDVVLHGVLHGLVMLEVPMTAGVMAVEDGRAVHPADGMFKSSHTKPGTKLALDDCVLRRRRYAWLQVGSYGDGSRGPARRSSCQQSPGNATLKLGFRCGELSVSQEYRY